MSWNQSVETERQTNVFTAIENTNAKRSIKIDRTLADKYYVIICGGFQITPAYLEIKESSRTGKSSWETNVILVNVVYEALNFDITGELQQLQMQNGLQKSVLSEVWLWDAEKVMLSLSLCPAIKVSLQGTTESAKR